MAEYEVLTVPRVLELLSKNVENMGEDYVYPKSHMRRPSAHLDPVCQYEYEGAPSCIVGHVLADLGVDSLDLARFRNHDAAEVVDKLWGANEVTPAVKAVLLRAQSAQDQGRTWGEALRRASKGYEN